MLTSFVSRGSQRHDQMSMRQTRSSRPERPSMRPERKPPKAKRPHGLKTMERPVISFDNPAVSELNFVHSFEDRLNLMQLKNVESTLNKMRKLWERYVVKGFCACYSNINELTWLFLQGMVPVLLRFLRKAFHLSNWKKWLTCLLADHGILWLYTYFNFHVVVAYETFKLNEWQRNMWEKSYEWRHLFILFLGKRR